MTEVIAITNTRAALRDDTVHKIGLAIKELYQTIDSGPLEGLEVISSGHVGDAMRAVLDEEVPPASEHSAEVATPATVFVSAECPRCHIPQVISVVLTPELVVDPSSAELRLKAKAKARVHLCGQLALPEAEAVQPGFELEDIVGEPEAKTEAVEEPETDTCPWPGCVLPAMHQGPHDAGDEPEPEATE